MPKVDIEASLAVIAAVPDGPWQTDEDLPGIVATCEHNPRTVCGAGTNVNKVAVAEFIVAARDPITGWGPALKELKEAQQDRDTFSQSSCQNAQFLEKCELDLAEARERISVFEIFCRDICEVTSTAPEDVDTSGVSLPVIQIRQWSLDSAELGLARAELKRRDEPVKPTRIMLIDWQCPCGYEPLKKFTFCPNCGRKLDWSGK